MIGIASVAESVTEIEACGPPLSPRWATRRGGSPLRGTARNPFLGWRTMGGVRIRMWRLRDVVLDAATMLLMKDGAVIAETDYHRPAAELAALRPDPARLQPVPPGGPVLVCGDAWCQNHYHFLNHTLPAIDAAAARHGAALRLGLRPLLPQHRCLLGLLGHDRRPELALEPGRQYAIADALFCDYTVGRADFAAAAGIQSVHDRLAATAPEGRGRRLYVARGPGGGHRAMLGEAAVIRGLARRGFDILDPGRMEMAAQIAAFRAAALVVGPHGAGLANIVFCRPDAVVYELVPAFFQDPCILALAMRRGLRFWADAFDREGAEPDLPGFRRSWMVQPEAVLARVDEIEGRGWRRFWPAPLQRRAAVAGSGASASGASSSPSDQPA